MTNSSILYNLILEYEATVNNFNELLKQKFNVKESPLLAKRKGLIPASGYLESENGIITFSFHGNGCRFEKDSIIILDFDYEFDSVTKEFIYMGFEVNRLFSFVMNNAGLKSDLKFKYIFLKSLLELESSGIILRNKNSGIDNYDYTLANV